MLCTYSPCLFPPHVGPVAIMLLPLLSSSSSLNESCYTLPRPFLYVLLSSGFPLAVRPSQPKLLPHFIRQSQFGECVRTGIIDRHFRTEALSEVGDLACRCPPKLYGDLHIRSRLRDCRRRRHKHLTAAVIEIEFLVFCAF